MNPRLRRKVRERIVIINNSAPLPIDRLTRPWKTMRIWDMPNILSLTGLIIAAISMYISWIALQKTLTDKTQNLMIEKLAVANDLTTENLRAALQSIDRLEHLSKTASDNLAIAIQQLALKQKERNEIISNNREHFLKALYNISKEISQWHLFNINPDTKEYQDSVKSEIKRVLALFYDENNNLYLITHPDVKRPFDVFKRLIEGGANKSRGGRFNRKFRLEAYCVVS